MKTTLKRTGAIGLAAVTIVAGLSFGPAAVATPDEPTSPSPTISTVWGATVVAPDTLPGALSDWVTIKFNASDVQGIGTVTAPRDTTIESWEIRNSPDDTLNCCARPQLSPDKRTLTVLGSSPTGDNMHFGDAWRYVAVKLRVAPNAAPQSTLTGGNMRVQRTPEYGSVINGNQDFSIKVATPLTAQVARVDHLAKKVTVTGAAAPKATITANGTDATAGSDGSFSLTVPFEQVGPFTIEVQQRIGDALIDSTTLEGTIEAGDFGTVSPFPLETVDLAPGTTTDVPFAVTLGADSAWVNDVRLTAPAGTTFPSTASLDASWREGASAEWKRVPEMDITDVTLSNRGTLLTGGKDLGMHGTGQYRWMVKVTTPTDAEPATDLSLGYTLTGTTGTDQFRATGTTPVTISAPPVEHRFTVTAPQHRSVVETSTKQVTFTGTAQPGTLVNVMFGARSIGRIESVPADGNWSFTATMNYADYDMTVFHRAPGAATAQQPLKITVRNPVSDLPFTVTSPVDGSVVGASDKRVTFTGTGKPGGIVSINNGPHNLGRIDSIPTTGQWSFTATMNYADYDLDVYYRSAPTAPLERSKLKLTINAGEKAFTITTPPGSSFTAGTFTLTGKGQPGGIVNAYLASASRGQTEVDDEGDWSIPVTVRTPGEHTFQVYYRDSPSDLTADITPLTVVVTR